MPIFIAPFATVDGEIIFTNAATNSEEAAHLRALDANTFGLEETLNTDNLIKMMQSLRNHLIKSRQSEGVLAIKIIHAV